MSTVFTIGVLALFALVAICYFLYKKIEEMEKSEKENIERITTQYENLKLTNRFYNEQNAIKEDENATAKTIVNAGSTDNVLHVVNSIVQNNNNKASAGNSFAESTSKKGVARDSNN